MTGQEKPKRRALHRGLDDIVNRDVSLTSKLLGRMKPPTREPLEMPGDIEEPRAAEAVPDEGATTQTSAENALPVKLRPHVQCEPSAVSRLDEARTGSRSPISAPAAGEVDTVGKSAPTATTATAAAASMTFDEFVARWDFVLRSGGRAGKLRICQVLYDNTYGAAQDIFFTSYEKLARLTGLEKKQCAINIKQLESLGFIERLNIYNTATRQGTEFKLHLEQLAPGARRVPRHYYYDEDLPR